MCNIQPAVHQPENNTTGKGPSTSSQPIEPYNFQVPRQKSYIAQISVAIDIKLDQYLFLRSAACDIS